VGSRVGLFIAALFATPFLIVGAFLVLVIVAVAFVVIGGVVTHETVWVEPPPANRVEGTVTMLVGHGTPPGIRESRMEWRPPLQVTLPLRVCCPEPVKAKEPQYVLYAEGEDVRLSLRQSRDNTYFGLISRLGERTSVNGIAVHRSDQEPRLELIDPPEPRTRYDDHRFVVTATCHRR
jgi:hypothetical protein